MQKIMFSDKYGLTQAVLEGRKTQTRRIVSDGTPLGNWRETVAHSRYKIGEEVAVAQSYSDVVKGFHEGKHNQGYSFDAVEDRAGWSNKMFVKAAFMPRRIRITNIRVERLQDISKEDCLKEGIKRKNERYVIENEKGVCFYTNDAILAFRYLIDKVSGKGTWESNPWVFVYDFELVK